VITPNKTGYGHAYASAFKHARGRYIVMGDADDTYDFREIPHLLKPLQTGEADLVIGSRFKGSIGKGAMPWHHKWIGNPVLTWFLNLFFDAGVSDAHSGFRAITREALEKLDLQADGMEFASEMIVEAARKGLRIQEVPISYRKRINGDSKLSSFSDGWRHLKYLLVNSPNFLFTYPGLILLGVGLFWMLSTLLKIEIMYMPGIHSLMAGSLLTVIGYQALFFGFFAQIIARKRLPKFFTLEKGATIGAILFVIGVAYIGSLVYQWVSSGFTRLPLVEHDLLGFVVLILGLQTFLSSFVLSLIAERRDVN
jgi:glycosyltransferase involved in cell wall biosynthesis